MKTLLVRSFVLLVVAASAVLPAGCLEQTRQAAQPPATPPVVAQPPAGEPQIVSRPDPTAANVSASVAEVARLHQSGLDESVVKAFVERATNSVSPTADELIYLKDIGVSPRVITAFIQQTAKMREQVTAAAAAVAVRSNLPPATPADTRPNLTVVTANVNPPPAQPATTLPAPPTPVVPAPAPPPVPAQPVPPNLPEQVSVFYQQLLPYGTWLHVADHGWCWQPSVVVSTPGWRPYADRGRWLHTDHGWYWQSDYAWGWAPFHYGRWVQHTRSGWLWVPDTHWGPAWVVWRTSNAHCGWAPLPPSAVFIAGRGLHFGGSRVAVNFDFGLAYHHFTFIPFSRFCERNPHYYSLAPTVVQNVYNQTTIINNIQVNNNVIINGGVPADRVASLTRSEIRKVAVRDLAAEPSGLQRLDKLEKAGNDLVIYRPVLNPNAPVKAMVRSDAAGNSRTELVPAGTLPGQKISGRGVYDTSTGVPVLTGYTTEPPVSAGAQNTVIINNHITAPPPSPAPPVPAPANSRSTSAPVQAVKVFGTTLNPGATRAENNPAPRPPSDSAPSQANNSLFRPLTPPPPVVSNPRPLTPYTPVPTSSPGPRTEVPHQPTTTPAPTVTPSSATPSVAVPSAAPPRPAYTPAPRVIPQAIAPTAPRPSVVITPPPQSSQAPASAPGSSGSSPNKNANERGK